MYLCRQVVNIFLARQAFVVTAMYLEIISSFKNKPDCVYSQIYDSGCRGRARI